MTRILAALSLLVLASCFGCSTGDAVEGAEAAGRVVVETMDSGGYTYVKLAENGGEVWFAVPQCEVAVGDRVEIDGDGMPMQDFTSKTLKRTFSTIYFSDGLQVVSGDAASGSSTKPANGTSGHGHTMPDVKTSAAAAAVKADDVAKADGGVTVSELFEGKDALVGKPVTVRGKVVKFNAAIMGKNWLHVQDGSGGDGTNDITVTTAGEAKVGDTVVITGTLAKDRDFGYGYVYALLIEDAQVVVE